MAHSSPPDIVVLMITNQSVRELDVAPALAKLQRMVRDRGAALAHRGRLALVVDGYNDDPRELYEIEEVRRYLAKLDEAFPYFFFVGNQFDDTLKLVASCCCDAIEIAPEAVSYDIDQFNAYMKSHIASAKELCARLGLPKEDGLQLEREVEMYFADSAIQGDIENPRPRY